MSGAKWGPASGSADSCAGALLEGVGKVRNHVEFPAQGGSDPAAPSTAPPQDNTDVHVGGSSPPSPKGISIPDSPTLSAHILS